MLPAPILANEKVPSVPLVVVPVWEPASNTVAPASASPSAFKMRPLIWLVFALAQSEPDKKKAVIERMRNNLRHTMFLFRIRI